MMSSCIEHARKLSSTSLSEIINQVREHKREYDNDKSEYMGNKAIFLLMQYWATRSITVMSKNRKLPEQYCWNIVFDDGQAYKWLMERALKYAIDDFENIWKRGSTDEETSSAKPSAMPSATHPPSQVPMQRGALEDE